MGTAATCNHVTTGKRFVLEDVPPSEIHHAMGGILAAGLFAPPGAAMRAPPQD